MLHSGGFFGVKIVKLYQVSWRFFVVWSSPPVSCGYLSVCVSRLAHVQIFHTAVVLPREQSTLQVIALMSSHRRPSHSQPVPLHLWQDEFLRVRTPGYFPGLFGEDISGCWFLLSAWTWKDDNKLPVRDFCPLVLDLMNQWPKATHLNFFIYLPFQRKELKNYKKPQTNSDFFSPEKWPN